MATGAGPNSGCMRYCGHRATETRLPTRYRPLLHHLDWWYRPGAAGRVAKRDSTKLSFRGLNRSSFQNSEGQLKLRAHDAINMSAIQLVHDEVLAGLGVPPLLEVSLINAQDVFDLLRL
jgi:hypothetical protein